MFVRQQLIVIFIVIVDFFKFKYPIPLFIWRLFIMRLQKRVLLARDLSVVQRGVL